MGNIREDTVEAISNLEEVDYKSYSVPNPNTERLTPVFLSINVKFTGERGTHNASFKSGPVTYNLLKRVIPGFSLGKPFDPSRLKMVSKVAHRFLERTSTRPSSHMGAGNVRAELKELIWAVESLSSRVAAKYRAGGSIHDVNITKAKGPVMTKSTRRALAIKAARQQAAKSVDKPIF